MILGAVALDQYFRELQSWPKISGMVVSVGAVPNSSGNFVGQVEVRSDQGEVLVITTDWSSPDPGRIQGELGSFEEGEMVGIPQNPRDPQDLRLPPDPKQLWVPLALALGGILFVLIPIGVVALSERKNAPVAVGASFGVLGALLAILGALGIAHKVVQLQSWPTTEASILESRVGRRAGGGRTSWGIDLKVRYQVEGREIITVLGSRGGSSARERVQQRVTTTYAPGQTIQIRYRPESPRTATFESGWNLGFFWEVLLALGLGLAMMLMGGLIAKSFRPTK